MDVDSWGEGEFSRRSTETTKEAAHYWTLSVKVLRGHFDKAFDYASQNDMYVTLYLPTASARTRKTRCIDNSNTPEWNEIFQFRVHSQVKNILEINVIDKDSITSDDHIASILFDVSTLTLGQKETKEFMADETTMDKLWVEFELAESTEPPQEYLSNGVLLAAPLSTLEVKVDKRPAQANTNLMIKLRGAYKEEQVIPENSPMQPLCYHINKDLETELAVVTEDQEDGEESSVAVPFTPFAPKCDLKVCLPVAKDTVSLQLNTRDSADGLNVRLDFDIPAAEKQFLEKRKEVVSRALQKALKLNTPLRQGKVPTVAVVFSGGSSRAMTSTYGSLKGLQKLGLLDAVSYITTVSGSTWASSTLYNDPSWSKTDLDKLIAPVQKELSKSVASLFTPKLLKYYYSELQLRQAEGHPVSPIDMWGLIIENLIYGKKHTGTLADQQRAISEGQNPLPIYTCVNMKKDASGSMMPEWCEFTPIEVGFPKYGIFVPTQHFGSEYYMGHQVKKLPETRIPFLLGMWSSFFSANLVQLWSSFTGVIPSWTSWMGEHVNAIETDNKRSTLDTVRVDSNASTLSKLLSGRPFICNVFNFMRGFFLHNNYTENSAFNTTNDAHPDAFPNKLTPMDYKLGLVDSGFAINAGFPPVLRTHRHADLILSFDFSWQERFKTLKETQQYCAEYQIPFPKIDFSKYASQQDKEVYMFEDEEEPNAPIVLHFPRVNISFKEYKAPGEKRIGEKELKEGDVDVSSTSSPYSTKNITFASKDFQRLVDLTAYNVLNNKETIIKAIQRAVKRKESGNRASNQ